MSETIRVNFGKLIPLFPLPDTVLLPHAILPLHIFEPRYRQMVRACLEGEGQLAIATYNLSSKCSEPKCDVATFETPSVRTAACVGQIVQHEALSGGRFHILLHGVCRARISKLVEPAGDRAYRLARLEPLEPVDLPPAPMPEVRAHLRDLLSGPTLRRLRGSDTLLAWFDRDDVPTHALLELIGFALVRDTEVKYRLLEEPDPHRRARLIRDELRYLDHLVHEADRQGYRDWPKGMSWN